MPNWCSTEIVVSGKKEAVKKYYDVLKKYTSKENCLPEQDFGNNWLGNIVEGLGIERVGLSYRGSVYLSDEPSEVKDGTAEISFQTETAWKPMLWIWTTLQGYLGIPEEDLNIEYFAEEPGCGIYWASSTDMTDGGEYYVDAWLSEDECKELNIPEDFSESHFVTKEQLLEDFSFYGGTLSEKIDGLMKMKEAYEEEQTINAIYAVMDEAPGKNLTENLIQEIDAVKEAAYEKDLYLGINKIKFESIYESDPIPEFPLM